MTASAIGARPAGQSRPGGHGSPRPETARPLIFAGARAALTAAGAGLAMVTILAIVGWIAAPHPGIGLIGVVRTAAVLWLVGHHVAVQVSGAGRVGMLPLGLVLLPGAMLWRAGRAVARGRRLTGPRQVLASALSIAIPYALLAGALAVASRSALAAASVPQAVVAGFILAMVAAGFGAARALAPWAHLAALIPARTRAILVGTAGSLAILAAAGSLATAMALASHIRQFGGVYRLLDPGVAGAGLLLLAQVAYLPNAVLWAISYMLGPGFAVGTGTVVAPTGSVLGRLPAFPLLTALPSGTHGSVPTWLTAVILAVPYLAGVSGGLLVARTAPTTVLEAAPVRGFCSGAAAGAILGVLTAFAGGPLGDGRMSAVGPSAWQVAVVAALEVGISAAVGAGAVNWRHARARWTAMAVPPPAPSPRPAPDRADPHVIYLDAWSDEPDQQSASRRPRGPSVLP